MNFQNEFGLSPEIGFALFFGVSFILLGMIILAALPGVVRSFIHHVKLATARRRRPVRVPFSKKGLVEVSRRLEGVYYFDEVESGRGDREEAGESAWGSDAA